LSAPENWTAENIPDQRGRTAVITGGNTGLGFQVARGLAERGAAVVLACRDPAKAEAAADTLRRHGGPVDTVRLDLAALDSVRTAAAELLDTHPRIDLLINNAGGLHTRFARSADGFELTTAVNHLGPFALTGLLLPRLLTTPGSRIVTLTSIAHHRAGSPAEPSERDYRPQSVYAATKLANLRFAIELDRRLRAAGVPTRSLAAHPGNARTSFGRDLPRPARVVLSPRLRALTGWFLHSAQAAALTTLRAATDPTATGGQLYGPAGWREFTGAPVPVEPAPAALDPVDLWADAERRTGVSYELARTR
jgi:NAD(P)-dependent dehydrogenase (short-subunit alcohol dehydrogenase family)